MSEQTAWVSRPIGGTAVSEDFAPSILFAILYGLLLLAAIYNFCLRKPRGWNTIQISTVIFVVERIVWFILRSVQARNGDARTWPRLTDYIQATVGLGFVGISSDAIMLLRCLLVNTTLPEKGAIEDLRFERARYRSFCLWFELSFLASTIPGMVAGGRYNSARTDQESADKNMALLYASTGVALSLQAATVLVSVIAAYSVKQIDRMRCFELACITVLIMPVPIYRLCVLHIRTLDILQPISRSARAVFYIIHLVPEWICTCILLGTNVRARFGTGKWGDWDSDKKRDERLAKAEAEKVEGRREGTALVTEPSTSAV